LFFGGGKKGKKKKKKSRGFQKFEKKTKKKRKKKGEKKKKKQNLHVSDIYEEIFLGIQQFCQYLIRSECDETDECRYITSSFEI